ncbi:hypothetical protein ACQP2U_43755 (plasmid) [Nocardia sp. CA-084685]|uniref:hypothetical protein n=1 Tax=Nocardia sp. CA-084685 TaxID=3239970 RepID=UPI003D9A0A1F
MTDSDAITRAFATHRALVEQLRERATAAFYGPIDARPAASAAVLTAAGELTGGDTSAQQQLHDSVLAWGMRQLPLHLELALTGPVAAPLREAATAIATGSESATAARALARERAAEFAAEPGPTRDGLDADALYTGALGLARRQRLTDRAYPHHLELIHYAAAAVDRTRDNRWLAMVLRSGNGWMLIDHLPTSADHPGGHTFHLDLTGCQDHVVRDWDDTRDRVLGPRIAAGQNLEQITDPRMRYLIAATGDTREGIYLVPGDFTSEVHQACTREARDADLNPVLHVHSHRSTFHTAGVIWHQLPTTHPGRHDQQH